MKNKIEQYVISINDEKRKGITKRARKINHLVYIVAIILAAVERVRSSNDREVVLISVRAPIPMQLEQMFRNPCSELKSCATTSKTVRRIVCRGEAELVNKSFKVVVKKDLEGGKEGRKEEGKDCRDWQAPS